jgi:hypothetical protein
VFVACKTHAFVIFEVSGMHSQEFYHHQLSSTRSDLPRIFGMTASPIKTKSMQSLTMIYTNFISSFISSYFVWW